MLHAGFSVKTFCSSEPSCILLLFNSSLGIFNFFSSPHLVYFLLPARSVLRAVWKKLVTSGKTACQDTFLIPMEAASPKNVPCWTFCVCNLCSEGSSGDILLSSWRAVMVKLNVALEPTVLQIPLYGTRAMQDLCQDLWYLNQSTFSFMCMEVLVDKTPKTSIFFTCIPAHLLSEEKQCSVTGFAFSSAFTTWSC